MVVYIRFDSAVVNLRGTHTGIFGLVNGLARTGRLSPDELAWVRRNNDWFDAAYPDPATVDPTLFDRAVHPRTSCWFKVTATSLLERVPGYLAVLDRHGVPWVERRSTRPGKILYEDDVQVVVTPAG